MISQLGRYEVIGELGQGSMGVVYKARDPLIDRVVAIKTINLGLAQEEKEEYEARFYQEAKAAGRLNHPNIVTIYDVGKCGDIAYIAMEFLEGCELRDFMRDKKSISIGQILDIVAQLASGLAYAHEYGIVHRDIKPSNIMLIRDGYVKITDFGIARMASSAVRTQTGMVLGSPKYMSPEQVMGKVIDPRSDIFSLGVMLYEMLTGAPPFVGDNVNAIMFQTLNTLPLGPSKLNSDVPGMLDFIVAKALAKERDNRYQNASDFATDLRACRETLPHLDQSVKRRDPESKKLDAMTGRHDAIDESEIEISSLGLSRAFDSNEATMRLAALTNAPEEIDALSKTLKLMKAVETAKKPTAAVPPPPLRASVDKVPVKGGRNFNLFILLLLVVLVAAIYIY
ncbi:MAG: serine/threonine-protein kinase [Gallionella sp.]